MFEVNTQVHFEEQMPNSAFFYGIIYHVSCARRLYTILTTQKKERHGLTREKHPGNRKIKSHPSKAMPSFLIRKNIEKEGKKEKNGGRRAASKQSQVSMDGHLYLLELSASSPSSQGRRGSTKVEIRSSPHRAPTVTQTCF